MKDMKEFLTKYRGALIGGLVAIIVLVLKLHEIMVGILIILAGIVIGNYTQHNKENVKDKLKYYIDKM